MNQKHLPRRLRSRFYVLLASKCTSTGGQEMILSTIELCPIGHLAMSATPAAAAMPAKLPSQGSALNGGLYVNVLGASGRYLNGRCSCGQILSFGTAILCPSGHAGSACEGRDAGRPRRSAAEPLHQTIRRRMESCSRTILRGCASGRSRLRSNCIAGSAEQSLRLVVFHKQAKTLV